MGKKQNLRNKKEVGKPSEESNKMLKIGKNILVLILTIFIITQIKQNVGYNWVLDTLVSSNLKTINKNKHLSGKQKLEAKMGFTARYFNIINENTPDSAIIIFPPDSVLKVKSKEVRLDKYIVTKAWSNYFVYPRKLIYQDEKEMYPELYAKATHVAIMNDWGYELLGYNVQNRSSFTILSLKLDKKK